MNKRILSKLPIREAKENYIKISASKKREAEYFIKAEIIEAEKEKILLMHFFNQRELESGNKKAEFRVFLTQDDYITQDLTVAKVKWKTGAIENMLPSSPWYYCNGEFKIGGVVAVGKSTLKSIEEFFSDYGTNHKSKNNIEDIFNLQRDIMKKRLEKKHRKITDVIDKEMECVPELPSDFKAWIEEVAFYKSKYIYYKYKPNKKSLTGYCTHCKTNVEVEHPKHNKRGVCPKCENNITFKVLGKSKYVRDYGQAAIMQKVGERIVIRDFTIEKRYDGDYEKPIIFHNELKRVFVDKSVETKIYEYAEFKQTGSRRWCNNEHRFSFSHQSLYDRNLDMLLDTEYRYSAIREYATHEPGYKFSVHGYIQTYKKLPMIEYFVKLKLYRLAGDLINNGWYNVKNILDVKGKKLDVILGVNKAYISMLQRLNANINELKMLQDSIAKDIKITEEHIKYIGIQDIRWHIMLEVIQRKYASVNKTLKYLQQQVKPGFVARDLLIEYRDYIENCEKLNYDLNNEFILFPKDLIKAHNKLSDLVVEQKNKTYDKAIKKMYTKLTKMYGWEWKDYKVMAPSSSMRIVHEGQALHHCVGTYLDRIKDKKTVVLFLRKKSDLENSFYTIEVKDGEVIQCRGMHNKSYNEDPEVKKVIEKFKRHRLLPLRKIEEAV
ncbi:MAG: PcfJ domain-containing protein [Clostridium sp.]